MISSESSCRLSAAAEMFHILVFRFGGRFAAAEECFRGVDDVTTKMMRRRLGLRRRIKGGLWRS